MSDNDLIRRGDALDCFLGLDPTGDIMDAIAALPAVMEGVALSVPEVGSVRTGGPGMTDEELIARLHKIACHIAADRIEALLREKAAAYAQGYGDCEAEISLTEIGRTNEFLHGQIAKWKARAERLEAALMAMRKRAMSTRGEQAYRELPVFIIRASSAALKGADHE